MSTGRCRAAWLASAFLLSATCGLTIAGPIADCNHNVVPDADDLLNPDFGDCNNNGVLDVCDVDPADPDGDTLVSIDRNGNKRPDECDLGGKLIGPGVNINIKTGHATRLPPLLTNGLPPDARFDWIAYAPDGTLYAIREQKLLIIDLAAWSVTEVVTLTDRVGSPTFSPEGQLYALRMTQQSIFSDHYSLTGAIVTVNLQTGEVTEVSELGGLPSISAIAFSPDGVLHAVDNEYYSGFYPDTEEDIPLYAVDLVAGWAAPVSYFYAEFYGTWINGLIFAPDGYPILSRTDDPEELYSQGTYGTPGPFSSGPRSMAISPDGFYAVYGNSDRLYDLRRERYVVNTWQFNSDDYAASPVDGNVYAFGYSRFLIDRDTGAADFTATYNGDRAWEATFCSTRGYVLIYSEGCSYYGKCWESWDLYSFNPVTWQRTWHNATFAWEIDQLTCIGDELFGVTYGTNQVLAISTDTSPAAAVPISTLSAPINNLAAAPGGTVYGVDGGSLSTVNLHTGSVVYVGPLHLVVYNIAYAPPIMSNARLQDAATCLSGPAVELSDECDGYDFNGDGSVDLRDLSGLWLIDQR